jgi:hypothetical protein
MATTLTRSSPSADADHPTSASLEGRRCPRVLDETTFTDLVSPELMPLLGGRFILKPNCEGSSKGIRGNASPRVTSL